MEPDLQHKPDNRVTNFSLVDIPRTAESDTTLIKQVCALLEKDNKIVCVTKRSMGKDVSILENLRDSLPGFVALLDHHASSDIPVSLAKALSLGSDETDEKILQSRWLNFSQAIQRSTLPFTLIVSDADSLNKSRLTQICEFLLPLKGRLILADCGDVAKLFGESEAGPKSPSSDNNVLQFSDRSMEPVATEHPQSAAPSRDSDVIPEPPTITDEVLPDTNPAPVTDAPRTGRRSNRNKKPLGWLSAGLGIGVVLGFLIANLYTVYGPIDLDQWINDIADGSLMKGADQSAPSSETVSAEIPESQSIGTERDVMQKEDRSAITIPPMGTLDKPQDEPSIQPTDEPDTVDAKTPTPEKPVTDLPALEQSPESDSPPVVDSKIISDPKALATNAENIQEPELLETIDPAERARLAKVYIDRAESAWDINNLQQSLLEIARGLDVDPDNQRLQELREQVLAELNARTGQ